MAHQDILRRASGSPWGHKEIKRGVKCCGEKRQHNQCVPSAIMGNVWSLLNEMDEPEVLTRVQGVFLECSMLYLHRSLWPHMGGLKLGHFYRPKTNRDLCKILDINFVFSTSINLSIQSILFPLYEYAIICNYYITTQCETCDIVRSRISIFFSRKLDIFCPGIQGCNELDSAAGHWAKLQNLVLNMAEHGLHCSQMCHQSNDMQVRLTGQ